MKLLAHLYKYDAHSMNEKNFSEEVKRLCEERGASVVTDSIGNLYVTKGQSETYPCIVAHLDEVHDSRGKNFAVYSDGNIIRGYDNFGKNIPHGIGADDKNGIWVALKCLEQFEAVKCAFFVGEEIGCVGSGRADMKFFTNCRFALQCDRRNDSDLIVSVSGQQLCSKRFLKDIGYKDYGYSKTTGLLTDVYTLKRNGLKISCVNMSCGYYNPHTPTEYTNFDHLLKCLKFVSHIVESCTDVYPHDKRSEKRSKYDMWPDYSKIDNSWLQMYIPTPQKSESLDDWERSEIMEIVDDIIECDPQVSDNGIIEEIELIYGDIDTESVQKCIDEVREYRNELKLEEFAS